MPAQPSTLADLRTAGIITSQEIVAAVDAYMRDPAAGLYRFPSGHGLDIAAAVAASADFEAMAARPGPKEKTLRTAVTMVAMAARLTLP